MRPSLFLLAKDLDRMLVWAAVNEADIGDIHVGQKVNFKVDAYRDRSYSGKVSQIRLNASLLQNVVTYGVVVDVDNADGTLMPYMTAKLQFEVSRCPDALLVPNQALQLAAHLGADFACGPQRSDAAGRRQEVGRGKEGKEGDGRRARRRVGTESGSRLAHRLGAGRRRAGAPVTVQLGLSDGMQTAVTGGELEVGTAVVVNAIKQAAPDFVSSFVSRVTSKKK